MDFMPLMGGDNLIELHNITKIYPNNVTALKNISLSIEKGEFVFIIGSSGSGKSTLLKLLLKEIEPTEGEIIINDKNITHLKKKEIPFLRRKLGVVFQDFRLLPNKTVYENVAFAMQIVEATPKEIRRNVPMVLSMVGLAKKARCYPSQLSGGEQQRTALARAIVNNPPILICDEPTGNLDPLTSWEIMKLLKDINDRGTTVIIATHEKDIVDKMKKRVIEIKEGVLIRDLQKGGYSDED
jgi:cell division transport system ATP-binding protein